MELAAGEVAFCEARRVGIGVQRTGDNERDKGENEHKERSEAAHDGRQRQKGAREGRRRAKRVEALVGGRIVAAAYKEENYNEKGKSYSYSGKEATYQTVESDMAC